MSSHNWKKEGKLRVLDCGSIVAFSEPSPIKMKPGHEYCTWRVSGRGAYDRPVAHGVVKTLDEGKSKAEETLREMRDGINKALEDVNYV